MYPSRDGPSKAKILLVDDEPANLVSLKAVLDELDLALVEAHSGEDALRLLLEDEFAVVLLDVQTPGLDGFETARLIRGREETRHTPIIFQTAYDTDRATIEKAYALGAVDFLVKPLVPVVLRAKVNGFIELLQYRQQVKRQAEQLHQAERREFKEKLAEENSRLQQQREWLRVTLGSIGDGVVTTDPEGRVTFLNAVAVSLTGWRQEQAAGRPLTEVFHIVNEMTRKTVENPVAKVIATGRIAGLANHTVLIAQDGTERAIDDSAAPIRDSKGTVHGVVLVFRDVTERRQAERTARFLASIVESSDDAIIGKDVNGIITSWNQAAQRLFGYSAAEAIGRPIAMLAPSDRADEMPAILTRIRRGERVEHFDTERRAKDGRLVPISLTVSPIKNDDGKIIGASKVARDISERKRAEEALREEKERLHATLTGIGDAVIVTDALGRVNLMNPVAQNLTGWKEEATGRPLEEVFHIINEQTRQPVESPVSRVIREGMIVGLANHTVLVAKDGTERPIEDSAAPVRGENRQVVGVVLVFRDATEQRQAEEAVRASQRREKERADELEAILRAAPTPIWIAHDPHCHRITGNPAACTFLGLPEGSNVSAESLPGHDPRKRGYREYRGDQPIPVDELPMQRATRGEAANGAEIKYVFDDARVRFAYGNAVPLRNPDGGVRGCVAAFADVTERKQTEEALRQSEQRLAAELGAMSRLHALSTRLVSATNLNTALDDVLENAILTSGADFGNIQLFNPQIGALEIVAQRGFQQDFLDYSRMVRVDDGSACAQAMQSGERIIIEDVNLDPAYEPHRPVAAAAGYRAVQSTPLKSRAGSVLGMLSTHYRTPHRPSKRDEQLLDLYARHAADLIERFQVEEALRRGKAQFRQLADAMPQIVWTARPDGYLDYYNERWYEYTGFPRGEYGQQSWEPILHPDDVQRCVETYFGCIKSEKPYQIEYRFKDRTTGGYRWFLGRAMPVRDESGKIVRWFGTCTDIDDTKRAEEMLKEADHRKDEFLATLAHELRNPLAPIRNALELLRRSDAAAPLIEQARSMMERQVSQMVRLVDDLLDISRITRGKLRVRKERVELADVLDAAIEAARPLIEASAHELTVTLPPPPIPVQADAMRLAQVFLNLLTNAAKYTEKAGHIWLTAERRDGEAVVSVRDTGIGIAAEHLPLIFGMFSQVTSALERSQGGLGIGLALVKGLVELHGGTVEARSGGPGKGSEFTVHLPIVDVPVEAFGGPSGDGQKARSVRKCRILVVDDLRDAADSMAMMLRIMGHDTRTAYDGLEAVQAAATFRPTVVLLDIGLPKMNGYEAARRIRNEPWGGSVVLVALTGWGQEEDKRRSLEAGFDHHLTKPVEAAALEKLLALLVPHQ